VSANCLRLTAQTHRVADADCRIDLQGGDSWQVNVPVAYSWIFAVIGLELLMPSGSSWLTLHG